MKDDSEKLMAGGELLSRLVNAMWVWSPGLTVVLGLIAIVALVSLAEKFFKSAAKWNREFHDDVD